jgi:hypothetical protein
MVRSTTIQAGERAMTSATTAEATVPAEADSAASSFPVSQVNKVKRLHERGRYDKKEIYEILDAALVCHIAYVIDGRPTARPPASGAKATTSTGMVRRPAG